LSVSFSIVDRKVKEAKKVKKSVAFESIAVEIREKLLSSCPVISCSISDIMAHLNNDP
jgi:hypothetical protein